MIDDSKHTYEYDVDIDGTSAPARVIRLVGNNKNVLEIGAGPGSITKHLIKHNNCKVTAIEIDEQAINKLSQYTREIHSLDLNNTSWPNAFSDKDKFDVIVAGDVLEHLYDPWNTLSLMKGLLSDKGKVIISIPHVGHNAIYACMLNEDFKYQDWGLLDKTHIRFFGLKNLQHLFESSNLTIEHAEFVITKPEDSEFSEYWNKLSPHIKSTLKKNKYGDIYQVVISAAKTEHTKNKSIDLLSVPIEQPKIHIQLKLKLKRLLARMLPENIKTKIRQAIK